MFDIHWVVYIVQVSVAEIIHILETHGHYVYGTLQLSWFLGR